MAEYESIEDDVSVDTGESWLPTVDELIELARNTGAPAGVLTWLSDMRGRIERVEGCSCSRSALH